MIANEAFVSVPRELFHTFKKKKHVFSATGKAY